MYALDRQELVDTFQSGYGGIAHIPWYTSDADYNDILAKVEKYPYDTSRAAAMFQELGYAKLMPRFENRLVPAAPAHA